MFPMLLFTSRGAGITLEMMTYKNSEATIYLTWLDIIKGGDYIIHYDVTMMM